MFYLQEMCCLCLKPSKPLVNLFSTDQYELTHFDKITSSLTRITNYVENDGYFLLCSKCAETIDMIYKFNKDCLKNLDTLNSYNKILTDCSNKQRGGVTVQIEKLDRRVSAHADSIKDKNEIDSNSTITETEYHYTDYIVTKEKSQTAEEKSEMEIETVEVICDIDYNDIEFKIEHDDMMKDCLGEDESIMQEEQAGTSSKVGNQDPHQIGSENETEEFLLTTNVRPGLDQNKGTNNKNKNKTSNKISKKNLTCEKPFKCHICGKLCRLKCTLNVHMLLHTGDKPYVCDVCNKAFRHRSSLSDHKLIHIDAKPYFCDMCGYQCRTSSHLTEHKRIHTGIKPYICDVCNKSFTQKGTLTNHRRLHTGERPFSCEICYQSFVQKCGLDRHKCGTQKP